MPEEAPPSAAGKGIGAKLAKKVGPLPVWGWGLVVAAIGVVAYRYYAAKNAASSSAAATPTGVTNASDLGAGTSSTPGSNGYQDSGQLTQLQEGLAALQQQVNAGTGAGSGTGGTGGTTGGGGTPSTPGFSPLLTVGDVLNAARQGRTIFEMTSPGVFTPTSYTTSTLTGFSKFSPSALVSETGAVPLYAGATSSGAGVSGAGGSVSPSGVGTAGPPAAIQPHMGIGPVPAQVV